MGRGVRALDSASQCFCVGACEVCVAPLGRRMGRGVRALECASQCFCVGASEVCVAPLDG